MKQNVKINHINIIDIKDLLPNILKQLGPKQFNFMRDYAETLKNSTKTTDEAPELVPDFDQVADK